MKKILILITAFTLGVLALNFLPVHGEETIYDSVIRLHVIAASDGEDEQALKLAVRDAVLGELASISEACSTREEAEASLAARLDDVRAIAAQTVAEAGFDYDVSVTLGKEKYPTRSYESVCFPAGEYTSLRITIGEGEGKNWWCVLFPQLCLAGAKNAESAFIEVGLTPEQYRVITETDDPKYRLRFKIIDVIGEIGGN